ncbi:hypothetical protein PanWU01x14_262510 [Parasponia andersonii]|uniref:Uncharacterized protein n=1 Tax=Parasponia andersonii TaxID=3476 RepID=A0A2P5B849_PARAD|nr:hypothetical protein PanWU01x14_262510 [Parasponia andersonii]
MDFTSARFKQENSEIKRNLKTRGGSAVTQRSHVAVQQNLKPSLNLKAEATVWLRRRVAQTCHLVLVGCAVVQLLICAAMWSCLPQPYMLNTSPSLDHFELLIQF